MARPLPTLPIHIIPTTYIVFAVMIIVCIFSLVTFLCASHNKEEKEEAFSRKKLSISRKNLLESLSKANSISSKALLKIVSWRKQVQHGDDDEKNDYYGGFNQINNNNNNNHDDYVVVNDYGFQREDAVWKKTIIKGEKCKPFDFSGKIEYDSE
ncbi:hypothetical protein SOVF_005200, partial [Spinacia oleracea]